MVHPQIFLMVFHLHHEAPLTSVCEHSFFRSKNTASKRAQSPWQGGSNLEGNSSNLHENYSKTEFELTKPHSLSIRDSHVALTNKLLVMGPTFQKSPNKQTKSYQLELQYHNNSHKNRPPPPLGSKVQQSLNYRNSMPRVATGWTLTLCRENNSNTCQFP